MGPRTTSPARGRQIIARCSKLPRSPRFWSKPEGPARDERWHMILYPAWFKPGYQLRNTSPKRQRGEVVPSLALRACDMRRTPPPSVTRTPCLLNQAPVLMSTRRSSLICKRKSSTDNMELQIPGIDRDPTGGQRYHVSIEIGPCPECRE